MSIPICCISCHDIVGIFDSLGGHFKESTTTYSGPCNGVGTHTPVVITETTRYFGVVKERKIYYPETMTESKFLVWDGSTQGVWFVVLFAGQVFNDCTKRWMFRQ